MNDLGFVSGSFFDCEVPKNKRYLLKYFKTSIQLAFLRYYLVFGEHRNFVDHTGYCCSRRVLWHLQARYRYLVKTYEEAKVALTEDSMNTIHLIEMGKFPLTKKGVS